LIRNFSMISFKLFILSISFNLILESTITDPLEVFACYPFLFSMDTSFLLINYWMVCLDSKTWLLIYFNCCSFWTMVYWYSLSFFNSSSIVYWSFVIFVLSYAIYFCWFSIFFWLSYKVCAFLLLTSSNYLILLLYFFSFYLYFEISVFNN
jgi:hypothetical protein